MPAAWSFSNLKALSLMSTRLPEWVITNGSGSAGFGGVAAGGEAEAAAVSFLGCAAAGGGPSSLALAGAGPDGDSVDSAVGSGTGGKMVGRNISSLGANLTASSLVPNSITTKASGTSVRASQAAAWTRGLSQ